jgi:hypothetical protein
LLVCVLLAGCGGGDKVERAAVDPPPTVTVDPGAQAPPTDARVREALRLPDRVPLRPHGDAPEANVAVVRTWLEELSRGDVRKAARLFSLPARFQNFTTVALIRTPAQAVAVTSSLPCGAKMTTAGGARGFVVYEAELTDRPGGACGTGVGGVVRGAVLVRDGKMIEWYRLPDRSRTRAGDEVIGDGPVV